MSTFISDDYMNMISLYSVILVWNS